MSSGIPSLENHETKLSCNPTSWEISFFVNFVILFKGRVSPKWRGGTKEINPRSYTGEQNSKNITWKLVILYFVIFCKWINYTVILCYVQWLFIKCISWILVFLPSIWHTDYWLFIYWCVFSRIVFSLWYWHNECALNECFYLVHILYFIVDD